MNNIEKGMGNPKSPEEQEENINLPEGVNLTTIEDILQQLENNPEIQQKAFGKTFTKEEFGERFPNSIAAQDLKLLISALDLKLPTVDQLKEVSKEIDKMNLPKIKFAEWGEEKKEYELVDEPKKWGSSDRFVFVKK